MESTSHIPHWKEGENKESVLDFLHPYLAGPQPREEGMSISKEEGSSIPASTPNKEVTPSAESGDLLSQKAPRPKGLGGVHDTPLVITNPEVFALQQGESLVDHITRVRGLKGVRRSLMMPFRVDPHTAHARDIHALIDTGCELNLVRTGLFPYECFSPASSKIRLVTANGTVLGGGSRQALLNLTTQGIPVGDSQAKLRPIEIQTLFIEADIAVDAILSFTWLAQYELDMKSHQYGLQTNSKPKYFIPGTEEDEDSDSDIFSGVRTIGVGEISPSQEILGLFEPEAQLYVKCLQLRALPELEVEMEWSQDSIDEVIKAWLAEEGELQFARSVVIGSDPVEDEKVDAIKKKIMEDYSQSVFRSCLGKMPPVRGPLGEATIEIKPDRVSVKQIPFRLAGERREALRKLIKDLLEEGKIEQGKSAWNSPAFPVPKKNPGEWRLVIDYRKLNDATVVDGHPLPRIEDILHRQGKHKMWTVLDLKDGFHQIPIKPECRHFTCMSTPDGVYQWKVLPMGLTNAPSIFQRMMDWIFKDMP